MHASSRPPATPASDLEDRLIRAFGVIARASKTSLSASMERGAQWLLLTLDRSGPMRASQLAAACELDGSTVSRHTRQLEGNGLVSRTPDPQDGRAQLVAITPAGRRLVGEIQERRRQLIAGRLHTWSRDDLQTLTTLMTRLADEIESNPDTHRKHT